MTEPNGPLTKADLRAALDAFHQDLQQELGGLRSDFAELREQMEGMERRLTWRLGAVMAASILLVLLMVSYQVA